MGCGAPSKLFCPKKREMGKSEKAIRAALLIQRWYRRYLARLEARRRCTWTIFQSLEYAGEQDQLKLYNFFNDLINNVQELNPNNKIVEAISGGPAQTYMHSNLPGHVPYSNDEARLLNATDFQPLVVESCYKGPHLNFPMSKKGLESLIDAFKKKKTLHAKYALQLMHEARKLLKTKPNINRASTSLSQQITICGDLHGKLEDLLVIFHKNGLPSSQNPYIFNGDFVDRGKTSIEVFFVLIACFLLHPDHVYLNRGNHEDHVMNLRYGFTREIMSKYKVHSSRVSQLFENIFNWLPLATIIDQKIFVVHGGISNDTDLPRVEKINRHKYASLLKPPLAMERIEEIIARGQLENATEAWEWKQILDLLWSDPVPQEGCEPNTFRGGGVYFGPDVTKKFLEKNGLTMLIRSHECKTEGYEYEHDNKCLTIFSASNYYDVGSNRGAFIKLVGKELQPQIVQFTAIDSDSKKVSVKERVGIIEKSAMKDLKEKICASRSLLMKQFETYDPDNTGLISVNDWCVVMDTVLKLNLPWRMLKDHLVEFDKETGHILYRSTCDNVFIENSQIDSGGKSIVETLYRNKSHLETLFRIMDKDNSGSISMEEFQEACELLGKHLGSNFPIQNIRDIAESIDQNKDGQIDINEFMEAFRLVDRGPSPLNDLLSGK